MTRSGKKHQQLIDTVRREHVPDFRSGVFEVMLEQRDGSVVLSGQSTHPAAVSDLVERLRAAGVTAEDHVTLLPDPNFGTAPYAVARAAVTPVYAEPRLPAPQISQLVIGMRVELLSRTGDWVRIRGEDGYLGWVHAGYVEAGAEEWAYVWERGTMGEPVVSLGADMVNDEGWTIARLPWGSRLIRHTGAYQLLDGRRGSIANGEVVDVDRLVDRFPPRGESVARTARRWLGAPYLWGGVTLNGVDCSGFTQAVMWMHGIALPRDSDLQARTGAAVEITQDFAQLRPGDLLYFAETGARISHVAISLGGSEFIHSALGNGGVQINDLAGSQPLDERLCSMLVEVRRMLPD